MHHTSYCMNSCPAVLIEILYAASGPCELFRPILPASWKESASLLRSANVTSKKVIIPVGMGDGLCKE